MSDAVTVPGRKLKAMQEQIAQLEAENKLLKAEVEAAGSLLLDVQQDCVALRKELEQLRVEGARADDC